MIRLLHQSRPSWNAIPGLRLCIASDALRDLGNGQGKSLDWPHDFDQHHALSGIWGFHQRLFGIEIEPRIIAGSFDGPRAVDKEFRRDCRFDQVRDRRNDPLRHWNPPLRYSAQANGAYDAAGDCATLICGSSAPHADPLPAARNLAFSRAANSLRYRLKSMTGAFSFSDARMTQLHMPRNVRGDSIAGKSINARNIARPRFAFRLSFATKDGAETSIAKSSDAGAVPADSTMGSKQDRRRLDDRNCTRHDTAVIGSKHNCEQRQRSRRTAPRGVSKAALAGRVATEVPAQIRG